ncbi:hypothetical protein KVR01_012861 [Diaporthe batatas]|uniref:uncharacterized protein n=1 Tax=Diaporthe batatas TaxID=748121 RepID=UPI001D04C859|nr:uncharacterized protein KVR01_012861 [Diaporthe batatas]KAG8157153.1 hypothetical protein KVR01_012861 [Diaporthe batatas]
MSSSVFSSADSQSPFAKIRASEAAANNAQGQAEATQPSQQPLSRVPAALDTLNDSQALALLLNNQTVSRLFQDAFITRVEEHQQRVEQRYNQRLVELEEYTRSWRDTTKELWMAVNEGTFNPDNEERDSLRWKGPHEAGQAFHPDSTVLVPSLTANATPLAAVIPGLTLGLPLQEWITDIKGSAADFVSPSSKLMLLMGSPYLDLEDQAFSKFLKSSPSCGRIFIRLVDSALNYTYLSLGSKTQEDSPEFQPEDIIVEPTLQNMLLLWKAFCILKDRNDYLLSKIGGPWSEVSRKALNELLDRLHQYRGASTSRSRQMRCISLPEASLGTEGVPLNRKLVIARPYHKGMRVIGAEFFDTGYISRKRRVSAEDIVITEETVTLQDIGRTLEQAIRMGVGPGIKPDHATISIDVLSSENAAVPQMSKAGQSGQLYQDSAAMRTPVPKSLDPTQPSLFQRTLHLSNDLRELGDDDRSDGYDPQAHSRWLAMGGEPQDVRSPSPKCQQERIIDHRFQAHDVEEEVPPSDPDNDRTGDNFSEIGENSDRIILDEQPKNVTFRCHRKRPLPAADEKTQATKRLKVSKAEPSMVVERQFPQKHPRVPNLHFSSVAPPSSPDKQHLDQPAADLARAVPLDKQDTAVALSPLPLPFETRTKRAQELQEIQDQLRRLGCRIEDGVDQADVGASSGNIETPGQPQADGVFERTPASTEMASGQELRDKLRRIGCRFEEDIGKADVGNVRGKGTRIEQLPESSEGSETVLENHRKTSTSQADSLPAAHLTSLGVPSQTEAPSGGADSLSTAQRRVTDHPMILKVQSEGTSGKGGEMGKPSGTPAGEAVERGRRVRTLRRG